MNRMLKLAAAAAMTAVLLASLCLSASAAGFPDAENHWAREAIYEAVEQGWLFGFEDGTMRPDEPVTGAQAAALLCRILDATYVEPHSDEWYAAAQANGLAMGFLDSWDKLDAPMSRLRALRRAERTGMCGPPSRLWNGTGSPPGLRRRTTRN